VKSLDKILNYLIILAVLFNVCAFIYYKPRKSDFGFKSVQNQSAEVDKVVNKYLQMANEAKNLEQLRINRASLEAGQKVLAEREAAKIKQEQEMAQNSKILTQAEAAERAKQYSDNPNMQAAQETRSEFDPKTMTPAEKEEYKRQYIENARRGGYDIVLSDNFEIIKATKIDKATRPSEDAPRRPAQQSDEAPARKANQQSDDPPPPRNPED
jgi:regulator of protease activity HflC (stomatin/prohibitin superfamily)